MVRASPIGTTNLIATSALSGNRQEQKKNLAQSCPATPESLVPQFEIAADGLTRTKIRTLSGPSGSGAIGSNYLQPGYRSDVLIVFPEDGYYCLLDQSAPSSQRFNPSNGNGGGSGPTIPQLLAIIHVEGGQAVTGDLRKYVEGALYEGNPNCLLLSVTGFVPATSHLGPRLSIFLHRLTTDSRSRRFSR